MMLDHVGNLQVLTPREMENIWKTVMLPGESQVLQRLASPLTSYVMHRKSAVFFRPHFLLQDGPDHTHRAGLC